VKVGDLIRFEYDGVVHIGVVLDTNSHVTLAFWNDGEVEPISTAHAEIICESR